MKIIKKDIVSALIYSADSKLFLAKKKNKKHLTYPGFWHLPGGGVETGETKKQSLLREIFEETGLDLSKQSLKLIRSTDKARVNKLLDGKRIIVKMSFFVYKVVINKEAKDIKIELEDDEFSEYKWIEPKDISFFKHTPPSMKLFKKLGYL